MTRIRSTNRDALWPVVLCFVLALAIPVVTGADLLLRALKSDRAVIEQELSRSYVSQLRLLAAAFKQRLRADVPGSDPIAVYTANLLAEDYDGLVALQPNGISAYPINSRVDPPAIPPTGGRDLARALENELMGDHAAALRLYSTLAQPGLVGEPDSVTATALLGAARCHLALGNRLEHQLVLDQLADDPAYATLRTVEAQFVQAVAARARLVQSEGLRLEAAAARLRTLLEDSPSRGYPSSLRRALLEDLATRGLIDERLREVARREQFSAQIGLVKSTPEADQVLRKRVGMEAWTVLSRDGRHLLVYRTETLTRILVALLSDWPAELPPVRLESSMEADAAFAMVDLAPFAPGLRLVVDTPPTASLVRRSAERKRVLVVTGLTGLFSAVLFGGLGLVLVQRRMSLSRLRNDLAAVVSHELRTPLASSRLLLDTLSSGSELKDSPVAAEYIQLLSRENQRLCALVENFLLFSRLSSTGYTYRLIAINTDEFLTALCAEWRPRVEAAGGTLTLVQCPGAVRADREALLIVLGNLIENALKYSPDRKEITVKAVTAGGSCFISVEDRGSGVPSGDRRRIFHRYYQSDQRLSRPAGGVGLGLAIVKSLLEGMRSTIDVENNPGGGSRFVVTLPEARPSQEDGP